MSNDVVTQVTSASDDGYVTTNFTWWPNVVNTRAGNHWSNPVSAENAWFRFQNVQIRQGANIVAATLTVVGSSGSLVPGAKVDTIVYGEASDYALTIAGTADYDSRFRTVASTQWDIDTVWVHGTSYTSPDIGSLVQEVVQRPGWVPGNALQLFWQNDTCVTASFAQCYAFDGAASSAAILTVTVEITAAWSDGLIGVENRTSQFSQVLSDVATAMEHHPAKDDPFSIVTLEMTATKILSDVATGSENRISLVSKPLLDVIFTADSVSRSFTKALADGISVAVSLSTDAFVWTITHLVSTTWSLVSKLSHTWTNRSSASTSWTKTTGHKAIEED